MMKLNCIVVDDEPLARKGIKTYINKIPFLEFRAEAGSVSDAMLFLSGSEIDLIFLDIEMPEINGVEFVRSLDKNVLIIFITAFTDYALEGYELNVIDYLLKPVSYNRFEKAVLKAKEYFELKNIKRSPEYFFIKCGNKFEKIIFSDLLFIEALENYVKLYTTHKTFITYITFKSVEQYLPSDQFLRVHKSYIISLSKITNLDSEEIKIENHSVPLSRNYKNLVMHKVIGNNLLKR
jgi:DNA-binding LytR/AlgR family response regulator